MIIPVLDPPYKFLQVGRFSVEIGTPNAGIQPVACR
jgi:hypothetical protein